MSSDRCGGLPGPQPTPWSAALLVPFVALAATGSAQVVKNYQPVTQQMLENPSPNDWLMYSRTYDAQRFSPLKQIDKQNVNQLHLAWERGMDAGQTETIPIVHNGVMYVVNPGAVVQALDAATGDLLWEYKRKIAANQAAPGQNQESRHLSGRGSLHRARCGGRTGRADGRASVGGQDRWPRQHLRSVCRRRQGYFRRRVRGQARELLYPGERRAHRQRTVALLYHSGERRTGG